MYVFVNYFFHSMFARVIHVVTGADIHDISVSFIFVAE